MTDEEKEKYFDVLAESIAHSLCEFNHSLLFTGLGPDQLLECAMKTFLKKVPGFADASEDWIQDFTDRLGLAICDSMLMQGDLIILNRRGVKPS
jgi:hypothetical protein